MAISHFLSVLLMCLVGLMGLWLARLHDDVYHVAPFTPDSAHYIEQARSVRNGNGFESRPYGLYDIDLDISQTADPLFPPGYPLAIAAGAAVSGASVEAVAPWINRIALIILPLIVFIVFRPLIGVYGAVCLGILGGFSPGVIGWAQYALTDVFSLTLVLTSFGLTSAAWSGDHASRSLFLAFGGGVVAGLAYLTRNANVAFLLATLLSMALWLFVSRQAERFITWRVGLSWTIGASIIIFPWLVRNLTIFGRIQPYELPPSTTGGWTNMRMFVAAQIYDAVGARHFSNLLAWTIPGNLALLVVMVAFASLLWKQWSTFSSAERRAFISSLIYAALGAAIVIAARTRYQWGEFISNRHASQFTIFVLSPAAVLLRHLPLTKKVFVTLTGVIMVTLVTLRLGDSLLNASSATHKPSHQLSVAKLINESKTNDTAPCAYQHKPLIVSNYAYLYRILCDANSRHPGTMSMGHLSISESMALVQSGVGHRPVIVVFHPGRGVEPTALPLREHDAEAFVDQGWTIKENSPSEVILVRNLSNQ